MKITSRRHASYLLRLESLMPGVFCCRKNRPGIRVLDNLYRIIVLFLLFNFGTLHAEVIPMEREEIIQRSELIFVGKVIKKQFRWNEAGNLIVTDYTFQASDILFGQSSKTITLTFAGGKLAEQQHIVSDVPVFEVGDVALLMIEDSPHPLFSPITGVYQGKFLAKARDNLGDSLVLDSQSQILIDHNDTPISFKKFVEIVRSEIPAAKKKPLPDRSLTSPSNERLLKDLPSQVYVPPLISRPQANLLLPGHQSSPVLTDLPFDFLPLNLPIRFNPLPDNNPFASRDKAQMTLWNQYASIFEWMPSTGTWAWGNDQFDIAGFVNNQTMIKQFGEGWSNSAVGMVFYNVQSGFIVEADIALNPAVNWTADNAAAYSNPNLNSIDFVLLHELGHSWGMEHLWMELSVMNYPPKQYKAYPNLYLADVWALRAAFPSRIVTRTDLNLVLFYPSGFQSYSASNLDKLELLPGESLTVSDFIIENLGTTPLLSPVIEWRLVPKINSWDNSHYIGTMTYPAVSPDSYQQTSSTLTIPFSVPPGTYYLAAKIVQPADDITSNNSSWLDRVITVKDGTPAIPTNIQATDGSSSSNRVRVSWNPVPGGTSYEIYRAASKNEAKTLLGTVSTTLRTFFDYQAFPGTTYYYWVKGCNVYGCSDFGGPDTGYRKPVPPGIPQGVTASDGIYADIIQVTWQPLLEAEQYEIYRAASTNDAKTLIATTTDSFYEDFTAPPGTSLYYWLRACNRYGCSNYSTPDAGHIEAYGRVASGHVSADQTQQTVRLSYKHLDPVVIVGPPSYNDESSGVVRVANVTADTFDIFFQEWSYQDGIHKSEDVPYLIIESGRHLSSDGSFWEAGVFPLEGSGVWITQNFIKDFPEAPAVFLTVQAANDLQPVTVRVRNVSLKGFEAALFEEEAVMDGHGIETVGYLAVYSPGGFGHVNVGSEEQPYLLQQAKVNHRFTPVLSSALVMQEEQSKDTETVHAAETLAVLALGDRLFAQDVTSKDLDTATIRRKAPTAAAALEWGVIRDVTHEWVTLPLAKTYQDPIVVTSVAEQTGPSQGVARLRAVKPTSFQVRFQEWNYLDDGDHPGEQVFYLVAEAGSQTLAGLAVQAGKRNAKGIARQGQWWPITFDKPFESAPALLAAVQTYQDSMPVFTRIKDTDPGGFSIAMEEEEVKGDGHLDETVGWIALQKGKALTPDKRAIEITEVKPNHYPATVKFTASFSHGSPVLLCGLSSTDGTDTAIAAQHNLSQASVRVFVQEDNSWDDELMHYSEIVSVFAAD